VDYILDPELVAAAAAIPKTDLSDLAAAREAERLMTDHLPKYETRIPLSVQDVTIPGREGAADAPAPGPARRLDHPRRPRGALNVCGGAHSQARSIGP
jgi:hypothetical protein